MGMLLICYRTRKYYFGAAGRIAGIKRLVRTSSDRLRSMMHPFPSVERSRGLAPADHQETIMLENELQPYVTAPYMSQSSPIPAAAASEFETVSKMSCTCWKSPIPNSSAGVSERCLTVFYAGTVNVFDNVPQEKAEAIMKLAACHAASDHENPLQLFPPKDRNYHYPIVMHDAQISLPAGGDANLEFANFPQPCDVASVPTALRLARKLSLARFLKRRKTRLMASYSPKFERCFIDSRNGGCLFNKAHADAVLFGLGGTERETIGGVIDYQAHGFETA